MNLIHQQPRRHGNHDEKSKSRSKSRSRSRETDLSRSRGSSDDETPVTATAGDVILRKKVEAKNQKQSDNNNNRIEVNTIIKRADDRADNSVQIHTTNLQTNTTKYASVGEPYSITQLQSNTSIYPSAITATSGRQIIHEEREMVMTFVDDDVDPPNTPRQDYPEDTPRSSAFLQPPHVIPATPESFINAIHENIESGIETPRADYQVVNFATETSESNVKVVTEGVDDIIAMSDQHTSHTEIMASVESVAETSIRNHRQDPNLFRPPSLPSIPRSPSPPFDGVYPPRISTTRRQQIFLTEYVVPSPTATEIRTPTPPADMSPIVDESPVSAFHSLARPPTPPASSVRNMAHRSPTPPPGLIKHHSIDDIDDIINIGKQSSAAVETSTIYTESHVKEEVQRFNIDDIMNIGNQPPTANIRARPLSPIENSGREGGLPFMEELRRRQRSTEDREISSPPSSPLSPSSPVSSLFSEREGGGRSNHLTEDSDEESSRFTKHGLPLHRPSVVQFTDNPPEIIQDYSSVLSSESPRNSMLERISSHLPAPPPPPPPPPPRYLQIPKT